MCTLTYGLCTHVTSSHSRSLNMHGTKITGGASGIEWSFWKMESSEVNQLFAKAKWMQTARV